jgi:hypothetical protein
LASKYQWEGGEQKKMMSRKGIWSKYFIHIYEDKIMKLVKVVLRRGKEDEEKG